MKIAIISSGLLPIPPDGWGSVETIIWDYKVELEKLNHQILTVCEKDFEKIIESVNNFNPDFVHLHYPQHIYLLPEIKSKLKAITLHGAYCQDLEKKSIEYKSDITQDEIKKICKFTIDTGAFMICLNNKIKETYQNFGVPEEKLVVIQNGIRTNLFVFNDTCKFPDKSIYLARIEPRKRQYIFQHYKELNLDYVGNYLDLRFNINHPDYLGEWNRRTLYNNLTNYANLVLLSQGEAHSLVSLEAMAAGLGLVLSEFSTANLDLSKKFIDVIPESKIWDKEYVKDIIEKNRRKSVSMRKEIRDYVYENFSMENICKEYIKIITNLKKGSTC